VRYYGQIYILGRYTMAEAAGFPRIRKVVVTFTAVWVIACAVMFWSMRNSSRLTITILLVAGGVPIAAMWGLLMVALYFEKVMPPLEPKRRMKAPGRGKKRSTRSS